jgi:uncharacterized alpha-E superfamily protein
MLSRVAERLYWMARYIERAENTARLVNVYANLLLDLPRTVRLGWRPLVVITANETPFDGHYQRGTERNVVKFLLGDDFNPGSILACLSQARENMRTTRDVVPLEAWEQVNELFHYARDNLRGGIGRRGRYHFLRIIIRGCQQLTGLLFGIMSHDSGYEFIRLGRNLERADMSTRILAAGAFNLIRDQNAHLTPFDNILWMNVLRSLSAYQMYRLHVRNRVRGVDVVSYLLQDRQFPRAVHACLDEISGSLQNLPNHEAPLRSVARLQRHVAQAQIANLVDSTLHDFIDDLQGEIGSIHFAIMETWFLMEKSA